MKISKAAMLLLLVCVMFVGCSKDSTTEDPTPNGGDIYRYQTVSITINDTPLSQMEYQGTLGGAPVRLIKTSNNRLAFMVSTTAALGSMNLIIPSLGNTTIAYNVLDMDLPDTADNVVSPLLGYMQSFTDRLDTSPNGDAANYAVNTFRDFYATADMTEKTEIAKLYLANKMLFDAAFQGEFSNLRLANGIENRRASLLSLENAVLALGIIAVTAIGTVAAPVALGIAAASAVGAIVWEITTISQEYAIQKTVTLRVQINGEFGNNLRNSQSTFLALKDNIAELVSFNSENRGIIASDSNSEAPELVAYFGAMSLHDSHINDINPFLMNLNATEGTTYSSYDENQLPTTSASDLTPIGGDDFGNIVLSITSETLELVSYDLQSNGNLNLKVKVVSTSASYPVDGLLHYTFNSAVSSFSGTLPIQVDLPFVGNWDMETFEDGIPAGSFVDLYSNGSCPNVATDSYTVISETINFGSTSFANSGQNSYRNYQLSFGSGCTITNDGPDTFSTDTYGGTLTYVVNGPTLTATDEFGDVYSVGYEFITVDRLRLDDRVYVRQ